ncbi:hypothetical protein EZJ43_12830 [Pedobacter changchengzhani]|uniref:Uncharacterized protein n=1 Tax=Pedobacter changchengzhani TaxID=2529274 RepID=A0A4R5MIT3_9SPHI|nr:DUF4488 domain-containing protein [Pedobacter changchengzhani]TDG35504.1 hypothetical protein EZJ43_12830 [Pedobacter changchengzhani]
MTRQKNNKLIGFWESVEYPGMIRVFETDGNYYTINKSGTKYVISLKGKYSVISDNMYRETAETARTESEMAFKDIDYNVKYRFLGSDQVVEFSGTIQYKDGRTPTNWVEKYNRVPTLD